MYKVRPLVLDPPHEIVSLDDYRRRNRLHRIDPDLQLLGAKARTIRTARLRIFVFNHLSSLNGLTQSNQELVRALRQPGALHCVDR